jgi:succinate dehydrogenase/fumarate reductase flavoprotein subunit
MNAILKIITWPYRTVADFVDNRPSGSEIKEHLQRYAPVAEEVNGGVFVSLVLQGTEQLYSDDECTRVARQAATPEDMPLVQSFAEGVTVGYKMATYAAVNLKRHEFRQDSKTLRGLANAAKAAQKAEKAEQKAVEHQTTVIMPVFSPA